MKDYIRVTVGSYDKSISKYENFTGKLHPKKEAKFFLSLIREKSKILDLGCGTGRDSCIFSAKGYSVTGIDLSRKMINYARKRCKCPVFRLMDMRKLRFKSKTFGSIWANASILHLSKKELPQVINEITRVLNKNGILYMSVKKGSGEGIMRDDRYGGLPKYWSYFSKSELLKYLKNFKIIKSYVTKYNDKYMTKPWLIVFAKKDN